MKAALADACNIDQRVTERRLTGGNDGCHPTYRPSSSISTLGNNNPVHQQSLLFIVFGFITVPWTEN